MVDVGLGVEQKYGWIVQGCEAVVLAVWTCLLPA